MSALFLFLSFLSIFGIFVVSYKKQEAVFSNLRLAFIKSSLSVSFLAVIFTESMSFFGALTSYHVALLWLAAFAVSLIILFRAIKKKRYSLKNINFEKIISYFKNEKLFTKLIFILIFIVILSLASIAFTTNNNYDSYTYHLPRVEHWIQDKNVNFFPTNNVRQLYLAPFAEYFVLNLRLLSGSALFVNFVQFFAFLNCLILASLIAKVFGLSARWQIFASVFVLTLPMGLLQATTTQTDLVVSFFLISFAYFGISLIKEKRLSIDAIFFFSVSFALGAFTKSTFYIFAFPFCAYFGICYIKTFKLKSFYILSAIVFMFLLVNFPFLGRNYRQFGSIFGPQKTSPLYLANLNEEFGSKEMLSNSVKNIGLHLALPNDRWNAKIDQIITKFHDVIGFPLNSEKTSWFGMKYKTNFMLRHDTVGNFLQIILFFAFLLIIFVKFRSASRLVLYCSLALVFGFLFFAFLLKWQPWQTRLDLPGFVLMAPFIAYALSLIKWKNVDAFVSVILLLTAVGIVFIFDPIKPILGKNSIFLKDKSVYIYNYAIAKEVESELNKNNISNVGLALGGDTLEWQYWLLSKNKRFEYVYFPAVLTKTPNFDASFKYRALIVDDAYLKILQISDLIDNKDDILEISDLDGKVTLVIYKTEQNKIFAY